MGKMIRKAYDVVSKAIDLDEGIFEAMITTEAVDRGGDVVIAEGARIDNYLKNPVVMWAHDYQEPPVAKALSIEVIPGLGIRSRFQFPQWNTNPQADIVRRLWAGGFLNATSIGFIPITSEFMNANADPLDWFEPRKYTEWEMLEFSIVPIPANQEALRLAVKQMAWNEEKKSAGDKPDEGASEAEPNTDPTSNDESMVKLAQGLESYLNSLKEVLK